LNKLNAFQKHQNVLKAKIQEKAMETYKN
jgi:hypothetical protein